MARFRKKPLEIEAVQYDACSPITPEGLCFGARCYGVLVPHVHTLEGPLHVTHGDWIVTGVNGERYPVKPDIFAKTYDPIPPTATEERPCTTT